jgi:undecaprenyl-diphosphatase
MSTVEAAILGLVQGLTEFLPVSSSGHLTIAETLLGMDARGLIALDVMLHGATLAAVIVFFARRWTRRLASEPRLFAAVAIADVPAVAAYLALGDGFFEAAKSSLPALGAAFIACGAFMAWASLRPAGDCGSKARPGDDRRPEAGDPRPVACPLVPEGRRGLLDSAAIGLAQAVALLPGVSRSGATIGAGLATGLRREAAFEFSFLAGAPLMAGALAVKAREVRDVASAGPGASALGALIAFASGLAALWLLRRVVVQGRLWAFGAYAGAVGAGCVVAALVTGR